MLQQPSGRYAYHREYITVEAGSSDLIQRRSVFRRFWNGGMSSNRQAGESNRNLATPVFREQEMTFQHPD
ncbi:hypothetical protein CFAM422_001058 [Trichoderma lentiforme]|uniref:Uncharacterized protein n=1 Tax=Trichoderma lentiforme TaxID=1567552 RepID=A0A9P5CIG9_9HYPO|nr:hypothetical protein CFAM422_001058 [Trichoderma lentiforme]